MLLLYKNQTAMKMGKLLEYAYETGYNLSSIFSYISLYLTHADIW